MMRFRHKILGCAVALLLSACAGSGSGGTSTSGTTADGSAGAEATTAGGSAAGSSAASDPTSGGDIKVAFVSQVEGIPYFNGFGEGAKEMADELGITYEQAGPATADSAEQLRVVESLIQRDFDAIAISPLDPESMNPVIKRARDAGIVVITSDADAPDSDRQAFVQQVTNEALGAAAMDEIAKAAGEQGQYAIVSGAPDTQTFNDWVAAIEARQADAYPDMELVGGVRYTADTAEALQQAQDLLTAFPDLKGMIAVPSTAVPGVAQAVTNSGKIGDVAVTGFGSPNTAREFVESGAMVSTVLWDVPALGRLTVWTMNELVAGRELQASNEVPTFADPVGYDAASKVLTLGPPTVFNKENIDDFDY